MKKMMTDDEIDIEQVSDAEADAFFEELRRQWSAHVARIDAICANTEMQVDWKSLRRRTLREVRMWRWALTAIANVAVAAAVLLLLPRRADCDALLLTAGLLLAATAGAVALLAVVQCVRLWRLAPWRRAVCERVRVLPLGMDRCVGTISAAAAALMLFVLRSPVGDGRDISVHGMDRVAMVTNVDAYFNNYMS